MRPSRWAMQCSPALRPPMRSAARLSASGTEATTTGRQPIEVSAAQRGTADEDWERVLPAANLREHGQHVRDQMIAPDLRDVDTEGLNPLSRFVVIDHAISTTSALARLSAARPRCAVASLSSNSSSQRGKSRMTASTADRRPPAQVGCRTISNVVCSILVTQPSPRVVLARTRSSASSSRLTNTIRPYGPASRGLRETRAATHATAWALGTAPWWRAALKPMRAASSP